jgi:hypothetical protein
MCLNRADKSVRQTTLSAYCISCEMHCRYHTYLSLNEQRYEIVHPDLEELVNPKAVGTLDCEIPRDLGCEPRRSENDSAANRQQVQDND